MLVLADPVAMDTGVPSAVGVGYTWATYYRRLASELGFYQATQVSVEASVGDTTRYIISDEFRDDEAEYEFFGRPWVYIADESGNPGNDGGLQRRILSNRSGFQGPLGALMVSRPYPVPVPAASVVEVTSPLPIKSHLGVKGLVTCINEALADIWIPVRLQFTGNGTNEYDLQDFPVYGALLKYNQGRGIFDTRELGTTMPATRSPWGYSFIESGAERSLITDSRYNDQETFYLDVVVRANEFIFNGSAWGYRAANIAKGLQNSSQQAAAPEDWVLAFAMHKALDHLIEISLRERDIPEERLKRIIGRLEERKRTWARACCQIMIDEFPKAIPERTESMIGGTITDGGWTGTFLEPAREVPIASS